jgi:hypothetical protein
LTQAGGGILLTDHTALLLIVALFAVIAIVMLVRR